MVDAIISAGEVFGLAVDAGAGRFLESRGFGRDGFQEFLEMLFGVMGSRDVLFGDGSRERGVFGLDRFPEVSEFFRNRDFDFGAMAVILVFARGNQGGKARVAMVASRVAVFGFMIGLG